MFTSIKKWLEDKKILSGKWLFVLGIFGLLLIGLSSFFGGEEKQESKTVVQSNTSAQYVLDTEQRLTSLVEDIVNGNAQVMITLESGVEYIYANEIKTNVGVTEDINGEQNTKTQQNDSNQKNYVTYKDADGNEQPLIITEIMPAIRGVVVVCSGGDDPYLAAAVKSAVVTALNINEKRVCVLGKN